MMFNDKPMTHCPFCKAVLTDPPIEHVRTACPNKPADFEVRIAKTRQDLGEVFDVLRRRVSHKKRRETFEEYEARLKWFGKRDVPKETDFDYVSPEVLERTMKALEAAREKKKASKAE